MIYIDAPQGSDSWLQARVGKITASRFKDARDYKAITAAAKKEGATRGEPSQKLLDYAAQVAVERIAGRPVDKVFENWQMREGKEQEPLARTAYDIESAHVVQEVGAITTDDEMFLYSPDGLIGEDGLLEIKTLLSPAVILKVIGEGDLSAYMDQCLGGLWLTGRQWIDLVLWAPALAPIGRELTIHRITRDENAIEALEDDLMAFAGMVRDSEAKLRADAPEAAQRAATPPPAPTPAPVQIEAPAPVSQAPAVVPIRPTPAPAAPSLKLGEINARLAPIQITADGLAQLGFPAAGKDGAARLYHAEDFQRICAAIAAHAQSAGMKVAA